MCEYSMRQSTESSGYVKITGWFTERSKFKF